LVQRWRAKKEKERKREQGERTEMGKEDVNVGRKKRIQPTSQPVAPTAFEREFPQPTITSRSPVSTFVKEVVDLSGFTKKEAYKKMYELVGVSPDASTTERMQAVKGNISKLNDYIDFLKRLQEKQGETGKPKYKKRTSKGKVPRRTPKLIGPSQHARTSVKPEK
jgi:hypothetical protein